jgi:flagellar motility protein MotE (MotC chaperone)
MNPFVGLWLIGTALYLVYAGATAWAKKAKVEAECAEIDRAWRRMHPPGPSWEELERIAQERREREAADAKARYEKLVQDVKEMKLPEETAEALLNQAEAELIEKLTAKMRDDS